MRGVSPGTSGGLTAACRPLVAGVIVLVVVAGSALAASEAIERARRIDARCIELESAGESALAARRFEQAAELFDRLIGLRLESPFVDPSGPGVEAGEDPTPREMRSFLNRVEVMLVHRAVASKALALWLDGRVDEAESEIARGPRDAGLRTALPPDRAQKSRRRVFSEQAAKLGGIWFDGARWREAADAYALARSQRLAVTGDVYDDEIARQQFNQAMAEFKDGRYRVARALLEDLRTRRPDYRSPQVSLALENIPER